MILRSCEPRGPLLPLGWVVREGCLEETMPGVNVRSRGVGQGQEGGPGTWKRPRTRAAAQGPTPAVTQSRCLSHLHRCRWRIRGGSERRPPSCFSQGLARGCYVQFLERSMGTFRRHLHLPRQPWAAVDFSGTQKSCSARLQALVIGHGQREEPSLVREKSHDWSKQREEP